jgi:glycine dehydrogenase subunit 1
VAGLRVNPEAPDLPFFKEFVVELPRPVREVNAILRDEHAIIGGYDLGQSYVGQEYRMLLAVTEMNSRAEIDRLVQALCEAV